MSRSSASEGVLRPGGDRGEKIPGAGAMGLALFLVALSVLFLAALVAFAIIRARADSWSPQTVGLPWPGILISTLLLAGCSLTIQAALNGIRRGDQHRLLRGLQGGLCCALLFIGSQAINGWAIHRADLIYGYGNLYGFSYLMLTGLHAAHVVGGVVALIVVALFASRGAYGWAHYPGVRMTAVYWHYLGLVWLVLLGALAFAG